MSEGIAAAQIRKEARYFDLLKEINDTKTWKARLLTIEIGARGLVGSNTFAFSGCLGLTHLRQKQQSKPSLKLSCDALMQSISHITRRSGLTTQTLSSQTNTPQKLKLPKHRILWCFVPKVFGTFFTSRTRSISSHSSNWHYVCSHTSRTFH